MGKEKLDTVLKTVIVTLLVVAAMGSMFWLYAKGWCKGYEAGLERAVELVEMEAGDG